MSAFVLFFCFMLCQTPGSTLFPYTTLFRSGRGGNGGRGAEPAAPAAACGTPAGGAFGSTTWRSEEHTSELQSLRHLVCRLLLEKKKTNQQTLNQSHAGETCGRGLTQAFDAV